MSASEPADDRRNKLVDARLTVEHTRERLAAAKAKGGVELHMSLEDVDVLVRYASAAITGYMRGLEKAGPEGPSQS
jgi:hypothetical protein